MELGNALNFIAEELHADGLILIVGGIQLHRIAANAEHIAPEGHIVALVAILYQAGKKLVPLHCLPRSQGDHHLLEILRLAQAVNAADRGHHHHIPPLQKGAGGAETQAVNFLVGGGILLDIGVRMGNIGLRLIVIVVGDKILHRVVGEKLAELLTELSSQRLIVGQHQRGPLDGLNNLGHGVGLARARHAHKHLLTEALLHTLGEGGNGLRLIACGAIFRYDFELRHGETSFTAKIRFAPC